MSEHPCAWPRHPCAMILGRWWGFLIEVTLQAPRERKNGGRVYPSRIFPHAFSAVLSTEGRVVGLCWDHLKLKGSKGPRLSDLHSGQVVSWQPAPLWVSGLYGHSRMQGYEASKVNLLKPRKYIHFGLVNWKLPVCSGLQERSDPLQ